MKLLWLIVVVLMPGAPDPTVFRDLCRREGGALRIETGFIRMGGSIYQEATLRCVVPERKEKAEPAKGIT